MTEQTNRATPRIVNVLCAIVALLAVVVLFGGWMLDIDVLRNFYVTWTPMAPLTAVLLLLVSAGSSQFSRRPRVADVLLAIAALIAVLVLVTYFTGAPLGLSRLSMLFRHSHAQLPELPAPDAAAAFMLLAVSLFCFRSNNKHAHDFADTVAATIGLVCLQVIAAYAYHHAFTDDQSGFRQIAPQSTVAVILLAMTVVAHRPTPGIFSALRGHQHSALLLRRLLPITLLLLVLVGLLAVEASRFRIFSAPEIVSWAITITLVVITLLLFVTSAEMRKSEAMVREREQELMTAHHAAETASNTKSRFMAVMSHELRTPLTGILGYADMLDAGVAGEISPEARKFVDRIRSSGWHLVGLIDAVLTYASGRPAGEQIRNDDVDLMQLCREAFSTFEAQARDHHIALRINAPPGPIVAWTDRARLRMVLNNLISNGVKFTEKGSVCINVLPQGDKVVLEVVDTGIGIDAKYLSHIFEPFEQEDDPHTRERGGMGLGMALTRVLCDQMGVPITVESEIGKGTRVELVLMRAHTLPQPLHLEGVPLLVVDDETSVRRIMKRTLERYGAVITEAENAQIALDLIPKYPPFGAIITDISMPGMNGIELAQTLAAQGSRSPIIFVTGAELSPADRDAVNALNARLLNKPFDMAELARAVGGVL